MVSFFTKTPSYKRYLISRDIDYTRGIYQAIGYKEFHDWLNLAEDERETQKGEELLRKGVEQLNLVSLRYTKKQIKWIRKRFLQEPTREVGFTIFYSTPLPTFSSESLTYLVKLMDKICCLHSLKKRVWTWLS